MTDMTEPPDRLDKLEIRKDTIQVVIESGEWATDIFEIRDAARRAREDTEVRGELER